MSIYFTNVSLVKTRLRASRRGEVSSSVGFRQPNPYENVRIFVGFRQPNPYENVRIFVGGRKPNPLCVNLRKYLSIYEHFSIGMTIETVLYLVP